MTIIVLFYLKGMIAYNQKHSISLKCKPLNNLFVHVINLKLFLGWLLHVAVFSPAVRRENNQYLLEIKLRMCLAHDLFIRR